MVLAPADGSAALHSEPSGVARALSKQLDHGKLVVLRHDPKSTAATQLDASGKPVGGSQRLLYTVLDPYASDLFQLVGDTNTASAASERPSARRSLQKAYDEWRKQFTVASAESEWRRGLDELAARQVERYLAALTLLDVEYSEEAVIAVLRLHDLPEEYTSPLKYGDVTIVWSPLRDTASISFAARQTTSSVVVKGVQAWFEQYRASSSSTLRVETTTTDQSEGAPTSFDDLFRKLFRRARIL